MSLFYKLQYLVGLAPWERMPSLPIGEPGRSAAAGRPLDVPGRKRGLPPFA